MMTRSSVRRAVARRRAVCGRNLAEVSAASFVVMLVFFGATGITSAALRATDKNATETSLTGSSRRAMEETLYQLRGANSVVDTGSLAGLTYTTSAKEVVVAAPGYDPNTTDFYLDGVTDYVAVRYDTEKLQVTETLVPGTGSVRPSRDRFVLAENVVDCSFTYRVREFFRSSENGSVKFTLNATPNVNPTVYINGVLSTGTYNASNNSLTVTINGPNGKATTAQSDVQVVYTIAPNAGASALAMVAEVDVTMHFAEKDSRMVTRTTTLNGAARLRNVRN